MEVMVLPQLQGKVARLLARAPVVIPERPWSVMSGRHRFDGSTLEFAGDPDALEKLMDRVRDCADREDNVVIWTPLPRRQRGRIPRTLRCGYTVVADGDELVVFQSVVFVPLGVVDVIATTAAGQFDVVSVHKVSAWDGTPVEEPSPVAC
jgi:hypothetical protein